MSSLLWKYYHDEDVDRFRHLLTNGSTNQYATPKSGGSALAGHNLGSSVGSPAGYGISPKHVLKNRPSGKQGSATKGGNVMVTKADVNSRDYAGLTLLHRAVSSTSELALSFATALLEHPATDLYIQDLENGWTALHRALYFGNVTIARALIDRDNHGHEGHNAPAQRSVSSIIKVKDHEGNSAFDVYNATIARRSLPRSSLATSTEETDSEGEGDDMDGSPTSHTSSVFSVDGEEVWSWGSNRNFGLGFKDEDDRQHPEKITLTRPDHLLFLFYEEYLESIKDQPGLSFIDKSRPKPKSVKELPTLITNRPIIIQDVVLSKLHSAVLTTDPVSNLYICGFGPGGRLGFGDETTRFGYKCVEEGSLAGKKVLSVALGQNHTLALTSDGEVSAWGTSTFGQLGYSLPRPALQDEEPFCACPRQIFGALKRERIVGIAASATHSVAFTSTSLYTWGKNEGQLGLMDSDSRSLDCQTTPRRVAASLFKSPIVMATAITRATVVLLANHAVCVFTNYGYNIVKFPLQESFTNYHLKSTFLTTSYDAIANHVASITSGGDTIAATTSRGDLFTINLKKLDAASSASTTNPTKIKESLSVPERVWSLRKGNWDGVRSASVAENGSVIICTHAGAIWRRVKRAKNKDAFIGHGYSKKDYKFQRVPGLTKVAAVRSTPFGAYAAIRKDCDVTRSQIVVDPQSLWQDIAPLMSISDLEPTKREVAGSDSQSGTDVRTKLVDTLKQLVLKSPDPEEEIRQHLELMAPEGFDLVLGTTSSEVMIPVHSFILGRSSVLRAVLRKYRDTGKCDIPDVLTVESRKRKQDVPLPSLFGGRPTSSGPMASSSVADHIFMFQSIDFLSLLNIVTYLYCDTIVDVWHHTRDAPSMAPRFRQARVELMKFASHLRLPKLESAARLMVAPEPHLNLDMALALQDSRFLDGGDIIIDLADDEETMVHSIIMCQRCPFFDGMFNGRAGGKWLDHRRGDAEDILRIDLKHFSLETFELVVRYIYCDTGIQLFDEVVSSDIDSFSELVLDVMAAANELMLDRLSQICQEVIGRFVNARNISQLLNAIAPCSVTEFKDAGLEYLCLQLEAMLENELLGDLDDELVTELNEVVRANQLNCLPFAKSGRAELLLHEQNPQLAEDIVEERQRRIRDMTFRASMQSEDARPLAYRTRLGSLDDSLSTSPSQEKSRRKSKSAGSTKNTPFSPSLRPKSSTIDLMFDMDDDGPVKNIRADTSQGDSDIPVLAYDVMGTSITGTEKIDSSLSRSPPSLPHMPHLSSARTPDRPMPVTKQWSSPALPSSKLDMKEIMSQASNSRTSALSLGLSAQKANESSSKANTPKMSQKERKKQQQSQQAVSSPKLDAQIGDKPSSPWQIASKGPTTSLKDVLAEPSPLQTVPMKLLGSPLQSGDSTPRRTASPDTRFAGQRRTVSGNNVKSQITTSKRAASPDTRVSGQRRAISGNVITQAISSTARPLITAPHSKSYNTLPSRAEPTLQLSMSDIIGQQQRELEVMKEAVAKRSLQEIQEEQAFQEWWDAESRRAQEEEAMRSKPAGSGAVRGGKSAAPRGKSNRGRSRGRGDGQSSGRGRGKGVEKVVG